MFARINQAVLSRVAGSESRESGQTMAEYGLLLAVIAVIVVVAAEALGTGLVAQFDAVTAGL